MVHFQTGTDRVFNRCHLAAVLMLFAGFAQAEERAVLRGRVLDVLGRATAYYRQQVASHGGYVYYYSEDLSARWGEGPATPEQVWVQPPGTPTVGLAYLAAWQATGDEQYRDAVRATATALVYGQVKSGGWTNCIDFDSRGSRVADYRNGRGRGRSLSSLDDGQTAQALRFLLMADEALEQQDAAIHEAATFGLDSLLAAQFPCGAFPQVWDVAPRPTPPPAVAASFPDYDWRTEGRIKEYWNLYTLNDDVPGTVLECLQAAYRVTGDERCLQAIRRLGDFLLLAQLPEPQPGWAQQYSDAMVPVWARKFEPPAVASDETQETIANLLTISQITQDERYLEPLPRALDWLARSQLPDGRLARFYELQTNQPLYMERQGEVYTLTDEDENLPDHYGWKVSSRIEPLRAALEAANAGQPLPARDSISEKTVVRICAALDGSGRWLSVYDGENLTGQPKFERGARYLSSEVFSDHVTTLSRWLEQNPE